jgi:predicted alpha/beta-hydrolase family hydrolase
MAVEKIALDNVRNVEILLPDDTFSGRPLLILAHGAGNDMQSPFLKTIADWLQGRRINVVRFNFPYAVAGKKVPDPSEYLENSWRLVIDWATQNFDFKGLYIGGKSMGARISTMIAADVAGLKGMVFLGYPLHPPGRFDQLRDEYLYALRVPMLFIQGTRDAFARMDLLQQTLSDLRDRATLHWIEGGDHSYQVLVRQGGVSYPETLNTVAQLIFEWIAEVQQRQ